MCQIFLLTHIKTELLVLNSQDVVSFQSLDYGAQRVGLVGLKGGWKQMMDKATLVKG